MEWLNEGNMPDDQVDPQCLVNFYGCLVDLFGVCYIVGQFPPLS